MLTIIDFNFKRSNSNTLNILRSILGIKKISMKSISIFVLLIYWSIILLAPVISIENKINRMNAKITTNK